MANYSLVVNSRFQPFSFERYIQPYQIYGQAYKELENQYEDLSVKANTVESMANQTTDPIAYQQYKDYEEELRNAADVLSSEGLSASSRPSLLGLKRGYMERIVPIQKAYETRQKYIDEQRKLRAQDNSIMFNNNAETLSLDKLIANPAMSYDAISGNQITERVAKALQNYKGQLMKKDRLGNWRNTAGGQLIERIETRGLTRDDIIEIERNPKTFPEIQKIINDAVASTGVYNWNDPNAVAAARMYAYEGLPYGLGETRSQLQANKEYLNPLERYKLSMLKNPPTTQGSTLRPWGMELVNKNLNSGYNSLKANLISKYGKGLNPEYTGKGKDKTFINPLKIKEEYEKYAKEHTIKEVTSTMGSGGVPTVIKTHNYEAALKFVQDKYGVSKVLTNQEYDAAKQLGFTNESTFEEMAGTNINDKIDASVVANSPTSLNLTDYKYVTDIVASTLSSLSDDTAKTFVSGLNEGLIAGEGETYEDIFGPRIDKDGNPRKPTPIKDVAYTAQHPNKVIIVTDRPHLVSPSLFGQTWVDMIADDTRGINIMSNVNRGKTQLMIARKMQNFANVKQGIPSTTSQD